MAQEAQNAKVPFKSQGKENDINRRNGNHHPNLWSHDFIQSLSSPYGTPSCYERLEFLIEEVKDIFNSVFKNGLISLSTYEFLQRLWMVDIVERVGLQRHFRKEIKASLKNIYRYWNEKVAIGDLDTTALGFLVLRRNGYDVSADVFQMFKNEKGQFFWPESTEYDAQLRSMLNLYRASEIYFQGEKIMKDAQMFAYQYLEAALKNNEKKKKKSQLLQEVEYILKYPWKCRVPRWEARNSIEIYSLDDSWMMMDKVYKMAGEKILELAILDFNILQSQHQRELQQISEWWNESRAKQLNFFRHRHVEYFFWSVCGLFEPEFAPSRTGFTKFATMLTLVDDIYDTYGTIEELKPFTTAMITWDNFIQDSLPDYMKICFQFAQETMEEITIKAEKQQGPRVRKYMKEYWEKYILSNLIEAEWISMDHIPTFEEYLKIGSITGAGAMVTMFTMILMDTLLPEDIMDQINKIEALVSRATRLVDDSRDFEDEKRHGENASSVECYVKDNPGSTREDALNHINILIQNIMEESKWWFLRQKEVPTCCKKLYFDAFLRGLFFIFKDTDGLSFSRNETKDAIMKILVEPINM